MDYDFFPPLASHFLLSGLIDYLFFFRAQDADHRIGGGKKEGQALLIYLFSSRGETLLDLTSSVIEHSGFIVFSTVSTFSCYHCIHAFIHV